MTPRGGFFGGEIKSYRYTTIKPTSMTHYDNFVIAVNQMIKNKAVSGTGLKSIHGSPILHARMVQAGLSIMTPVFEDPAIQSLVFPFDVNNPSLVGTVNYPANNGYQMAPPPQRVPYMVGHDAPPPQQQLQQQPHVVMATVVSLPQNNGYSQVIN
jgi:hypothetical protein